MLDNAWSDRALALTARSRFRSRQIEIREDVVQCLQIQAVCCCFSVSVSGWRRVRAVTTSGQSELLLRARETPWTDRHPQSPSGNHNRTPLIYQYVQSIGQNVTLQPIIPSVSYKSSQSFLHSRIFTADTLAQAKLPPGTFHGASQRCQTYFA